MEAEAGAAMAAAPAWIPGLASGRAIPAPIGVRPIHQHFGFGKSAPIPVSVCWRGLSTAVSQPMKIFALFLYHLYPFKGLFLLLLCFLSGVLVCSVDEGVKLQVWIRALCSTNIPT